MISLETVVRRRSRRRQPFPTPTATTVMATDGIRAQGTNRIPCVSNRPTSGSYPNTSALVFSYLLDESMASHLLSFGMKLELTPTRRRDRRERDFIGQVLQVSKASRPMEAGFSALVGRRR